MEIMDVGTQMTFIWRILEATESGAIEWEATTDTHFRTRILPFGYTISSKDHDDFAPYAFGVYKFETEDEEEHPKQLSEWETAPHSPINDALQALYAVVKRRTQGLDTLVGEMFESLSKVDGGSPTPEPMQIPPDDLF